MTEATSDTADEANAETYRYSCDDCGAPLEYTGEQTRTPRGEWRSKYRCPNTDCSTEEVLLR